MLQSKAALQKDLIASEEQRLLVSKVLIDLQLSSSQVTPLSNACVRRVSMVQLTSPQATEAAEAAKFEQGQRLLSCTPPPIPLPSVPYPHHPSPPTPPLSYENDILELEIELQVLLPPHACARCD